MGAFSLQKETRMIVNKKPITTHVQDQLVTMTVDGSKWQCWLENDPRVVVNGSTEQEAIDNMLDVMKMAKLTVESIKEDSYQAFKDGDWHN